MGLVINHNMPAVFASYQLDGHYSRLAGNTERLSSGLRINGAEDDPAGYGIRELMRSEIQLMDQGIRNASDGISLLQTAEGALAVIDEKLLRMRELAEQAATGTYTTLQREIINSEYQAMAAEIDRIASATEFNGVKLLDGSVNKMHNGQGIKIHFGAGDSRAEDYYFVKIGDTRATTATGLRVGGDAKNDIWSTNGFSGTAAAAGCCGGGIPSLSQPVSAWAGGSIFSYGYNWDEAEYVDTELDKGRYVAGAYEIEAGTSLERLIDAVNKGTQSRVRIDFRVGDDGSALVAGDVAANANRICIGDEVYYFGSAELAATECEPDTQMTDLAAYYSGPGVGSAEKVLPTGSVASALTAAINSESRSFWAKAEDHSYRTGYVSVYVFNREGGDHDDIKGSDERLGAGISGDENLVDSIMWFNDEANGSGRDGSYFGNGGEYWGRLRAEPTGLGTWGVSLHGRDVGDERDLWILNTGASSAASSNLDINFYGYSSGPDGFGLVGTATGLNRESFFEVQNASAGDWAGASIRTQSTAQEALEALSAAILEKEGIRARLGAIVNRLENTLMNLETMRETLQTAESRISDVDVATEMTDFVRNQVLSQAAVSILSQANAMPEMALSLLNG